MKILDHLHRKRKFTSIPSVNSPSPPSFPPPSGPPPPPTDHRPPLIQVPLPKVQPWHQPALSEQGWTTITFSNHPPPSPSSSPHSSTPDPFLTSLQALFSASKSFFALPPSYKSTFETKSGSEEGWTCIPGEKEFITLRSTDNCPPELFSAVSEAWVQAGQVLNDTLARIAETLGLPPHSLTAYSEPCAEFRKERTATMLRLFRYEGNEEKVVAEPHCDLGLLSFVMGDSPGLEVWNRHTGSFWAIEKSYDGGPAGSLLVGRQLQRLSNGRYMAGGHRVQAYGAEQDPSKVESESSPTSSSPSEGPYRYSIVFVLRAHSPVPIDTDLLTTEITGPFSDPLKCSAGELFTETKRRHYNINTGIKQREEQKKTLKEKKVLPLQARGSVVNPGTG
ncbi:hypothetical protein GYMLUDRAFT_43145 [Collybiopsis luxurians FD-317 M1]|uniref:Unplaced genomic scaffold GYMLUscaffold_24, whole genome shotgun sequence n=1 Tax=Collybiopsis luxurians FD-317 M1 TaxID=944289 RepID=A0A0D0BYY8_9AGAR|nr:hypothetical protein GYMLUDRAFT_43145 [Collybiopsis luxurians FD-317 M1]